MPSSDLCPVRLETERLYLHELRPEHYLKIFGEWSDADIMAYFGMQTEEELEAERDKVNQGISTYFFTFRHFRLVSKATGAVIGRCDFHTWAPKHRRAEVGYHLLHNKDRGKSYMTEALQAVLVHGFEQMDLYRVEALIATYNEPSLRLVKHFGFTREGLKRGHYMVNGVSEDSVLFSLIRPEYEQLKAGWLK